LPHSGRAKIGIQIQKKLHLSVLLLVWLCLSTMQLAAQKTSPGDLIYDQVRMKLATDADVKGGALDITVKDGMVIIKGRVDTEEARPGPRSLRKELRASRMSKTNWSLGFSLSKSAFALSSPW
jgi:hypothetical protein